MTRWLRTMALPPLAACSILGGPSLEGEWSGSEDCAVAGFALALDLKMELEQTDAREYEGDFELGFAFSNDSAEDPDPSLYDAILDVEDVGGWPKQVDLLLVAQDCEQDDPADCEFEYRGDWEDRDSIEIDESYFGEDWVDLRDIQGCDFDLDRE